MVYFPPDGIVEKLNLSLSRAPVSDKAALYEALQQDIWAVLGDETDPVAWMATLACLIKERMGFFWVGFYIVRDGELVIGPYQGTVGCLRISFDRGVCGACASRGETVVVADVHQFPGHIACDSRSNSEIVIPVFDGSRRLRAVLDIDSESFDAFDAVDRQALESIASRMRDLKWTEAL